MKRNFRLAFLLKWCQAPVFIMGAILISPTSFAAEQPPADANGDAGEPEAATEAATPEPADADAADADAADADAADADAADAADDEETTEPEESADAEETAEEPAEYRNWVEFSVGGVMVDGDKAAFQRRYGLPGTAFGGVQDFHFEEDIGKKGLFKVDGRGIFDDQDYSLRFDIEHPDIGYVRAGYRQFRSFYDGSGGFFGPSGSWLRPFDDELYLDRGNAFFEAGLTLPNKPVITFRYDHQFRDGRKDSTAWGDLTIPGYGVRKIVPSFWDIDESRHIFAGDVRHTLGSTTLGLGLRYEISDHNNTRNILRNPGETSARSGTSRERVDTDLFNVHAFSETRFSEKILFTSGYSFTTLDSDLSGYRVYGTRYDPVFANRLPAPDSFQNLSGGSDLKQHVANLNLALQLTESLLLIPSLRIEREDVDSSSFYESPAGPFSPMPYGIDNERGLLDVSERLELRYTGITNWVLYARGEWLQGSGDLRERWGNLGTGATVVDRATDDTRFWQTYKVGANWYPLPRLNFGVQYYHKDRWNDYDHRRDSTANQIVTSPSVVYPAFLTAHDFTTDDANVRVTWRPMNKLTLVGRYEFQYSTIDTEPDRRSGLSQRQSAEMTSHIVGGSLSWTPLQRLYLQGGVNFVWDQTDTPADEITRAVQKAKNDYWTVNSSAGYALDDKTDLELQYLYYRADNLQNNYASGMPYGADAREHGVTAAVIRRISERMRVSLKYGFFDGEDRTAGHRNDYQAHLVYSSLHYRF